MHIITSRSRLFVIVGKFCALVDGVPRTLQATREGSYNCSSTLFLAPSKLERLIASARNSMHGPFGPLECFLLSTSKPKQKRSRLTAATVCSGASLYCYCCCCCCCCLQFRKNYYERMRISYFDHAKQIGIVFEFLEASDVRRPSTFTN